MYKVWLSIGLLISFVATAVNAADYDYEDVEVYQQVYSNISNKYAVPTTATQAAMMTLKAMPKVDKNLAVADDGKRVSLYYKSRIIKSFLKPQEENDATKAAQLTTKVIKAAQEISPVAATKDFDIVDILLENGLKMGLDGDSQYYPSLSAEKKGLLKNRRNFASRMEDDILYVKILAFNNFTKKSLLEAIKEHPEATGLILDLRGSPGGLFNEALEISSIFLEDAIVTSTKVKEDGPSHFYTSNSGDKMADKPMVVLVDGNTTSSAEIVASAMQEQGRAQLVGTGTYGKGTMQELISLPNGAELGITTAYFYSPSDKSLNKKGVEPDVCTYEMLERKNLEEILKKKSKEACPKQDRSTYNLEIELAKKIIQQKI